MKTIFASLLVLLQAVYVLNGYAAEDFKVLAPGHEAKITYQVLDEGKLLVSVLDTEGNPIRELKPEDFVVQWGIKRGRILSAEPLVTSQEIPLNIVLVVDNSFSMKQRQAVEPLLSAMEEFFKTVRPIDNIHAVVFSSKETLKVKAYDLHAKTFQSSEISELRGFLRDAFDRGVTSGTYLYEAMVAGLDLIRSMPERDQKFLVVFSDGEDINSALKQFVVASEAEGIANFEAYCVDYMPGSKTDPFLTTFAEGHGGRIWKAGSATEFLPIFQSFTTTLLYRYVVSYRILDPPRGTLALAPEALSFDAVTMIGGAPVMNKLFFETGSSEIPRHYVLFEEPSQRDIFDERRLTRALDKHCNVLNLVGKALTENPSAHVRIVGCNSDTGVEKGDLDLSMRRAEAVSEYLSRIWGIDPTRMTLQARNLPASPTPAIVPGSRPENQRVEINFDSMDLQDEAAEQLIVEMEGREEITITPQIVAEYGLAHWELTILADHKPIKILKGTDDLQPSYTFSLNEVGREDLAACRQLEARIRVADIHDDTLEASAGPVQIRLSTRELIHELVGPPQGSVAVEPETLTIEELTTIDSSPLLNYVFFETGESDIPERYALFDNQADTETFHETNLKGTMEKHYHLLNILGKRLLSHPDSRIKIVGCNTGRGVEQGRTDLSRSRAEAVRSYLRYIWGIDVSRMDVEAGGMPAVASSSSVEEGRVENQRAEIYSDSPELLDTIRSTYVEEITDTTELRILPQIQAGYNIAQWTIRLTGDGQSLGSLEGEGDFLPAYTFDLRTVGLRSMASCGEIQVGIEVKDGRGQSFQTSDTSSIRFIKREERLAQKMGYKVLEKYALILFDFDQAEIRAHNKVVLDRIAARINELPHAKVTLTGHTDTIGKELYNVDLSRRRAKAAYDALIASGVAPRDGITFDGAGPYDPLFDNSLPEGRAFNRTVTITLEYEAKH